MHRILFSIVFSLLLKNLCFSQQNSTLFFMQATPQANFVNPAVRNECKWLIGLPVISSLHVNYGNSAFSANQIMDASNFDGVVSKAKKTNFITSELQANLLFLGFWIKESYLTFSINEKADLFATYSGDALALAWNGNTQFEGKTAKLGNTGAFLNYRREFAFGIARKASDNLDWGIRAKLLFGKLSTSMAKSNMDLHTDASTFDISITSNWQVNTSLPLVIARNKSGNYDSYLTNGTVGGILFNRKNIGFAFDFGFVNYRDDKITIAGSILDLGFVYWASNLNSFSGIGNYAYTGNILSTNNISNFIDDFLGNIKDDLGIKVDNKSYVSFLNPMAYLGATYAIKTDLNAGLLLSSRINRYRITTGVTLSLNKTFNKKSSVSISYSYIYNSFKNLGAGVKLGKQPVQFYAVSDNILGFIKPFDTRNINLRLGLQINFGCNRKQLEKGRGCTWINQAEDRRIRNNRLLKKKN